MAVSFFPTPTSSRGLSLLITAAVLAVSYLPTQSAFSPPLTAVHHGGCSLRQSVLRFSSKKLPTTSFPLLVNYNKNGDDGDGDEDSARPFKRPSDTLVVDTARKLQRISWLSWWSQIILTVTSAVILTFAKNVVTGVRDAQVNFFLAGSGIIVSFVSIFWTWGGGARLSRRLLRKTTPRTQAANMLRRAISVGVTLNLAGMALTLLGAEQTVGVLAIKVLTARPWNNAGGLPLMATNEGLQPLDILVVQANTNVLFSHFCSLVALLYLTRFVKKLDPPSSLDDERQRT